MLFKLIETPNKDGHRQKHAGFSLVEVIITMAIFSLIIFSVIQLFLVSQEAGSVGKNSQQAMNLINEYLEEIKNIRRFNWDNLSEGKYSIIANYNNDLILEATTSGEIVGNFTRFLEIEPVERDLDGKLTSEGGTLDPSTKKIRVTVSWKNPHGGSIVQETYLTRYFDNLAWTQTTFNEFSEGTTLGTTIIHHNNDPANPDGEITLGAGGRSNWCNPNLVNEINLPKQGVAKSVTAVEGHAFAGTGENASGESFAHISITNDNPPLATLLGVFNGYKTNDVYGENINGYTYGYIATDTNDKEIVILDITQTPYSEIGYFNAEGINDANSIRVFNNVGYMTQGNMFRIFQLTDQEGNPDRSGSRTQLGAVQLQGIGNKFAVISEDSGIYAYIPISGSVNELQIIDVTNASNPILISSLNVDAQTGRPELNQAGIDVYVNPTGTKAFLVTGYYVNRTNFFIIDIADKENPVIISYQENGVTKYAEYSTNTMQPKGVEVVPGSVAIIVGEGGEEYQVVRIGNDIPVRCGGRDFATGIFDSASVLSQDYIAYTYIVTGDASLEFKIIEGGPGGNFATNGYYESQTLNTNHPTAFNRFFVNSDTNEPITAIKYQIAVMEPINFICQDVIFSDIDFVGPDGTHGSYFETESPIPFNDFTVSFENPGQCFRFRAYLETADFTQTPTLYDFTVNYSP